MDCKIFTETTKLNFTSQVYPDLGIFDETIKSEAYEENICNTDDLKEHLHDNILAKEPYKCEFYENVKSSLCLNTNCVKTKDVKKPFVCDVCEKRFERKYHLKRHQQIHLRDRDRQVKRETGRVLDEKQLSTSVPTNIDERQQHQQRYECEVCKKTFLKEACYKIHLYLHTDEQPFKCRVCEAAFSERSDLKLHKRTHDPKRPFTCEICSKKFSRSSQLTMHFRIHTGDKPYKCDVCKKRFNRSFHLNRHRVSHIINEDRPHKCDVCQKGFAESCLLKVHLRVHTGERPYTCEVCEKNFTKSSDLTVHVRTHTDERPFKCEMCEKRFSDASSFKQHVLTIHIL